MLKFTEVKLSHKCGDCSSNEGELEPMGKAKHYYVIPSTELLELCKKDISGVTPSSQYFTCNVIARGGSGYCGSRVETKVEIIDLIPDFNPDNYRKSSIDILGVSYTSYGKKK